MNIGDLFLGLKIDPSTDLKSLVTKSATDAGTAGSKALADKMTAGFKVIGVAASAGFALATKGALEAEKAQGAFMAATGKSREEAKAFVSGMDSLAGSAGAVGRSFDEIAAAGTMVEQQFGTTGQATTDLTEQVLEFSKVSGVNATKAADDLDAALGAFGLSADDAAGFMDQLVASNQTFGTNIGASVDALNKMAPALQAMGMGIDDGIELLNAFETAEVDAGSAQRGLQQAIAQLKPGQNLDDLIAQIGAIEDPTLRAQKAIEIFGTKAGAGLAQVIKPGMTSLDDFGISAEEASGALHKGADAMVTDADKIRGVFDKLAAGAREVGQDFGPALTGLASLTTLVAPFTKGAKTLIAKVAAAILPAATAAGAAEGVAQAEAATGASVLSQWLKKFGLMTPAKVAAAEVAGTTVGAAEGGAAATGFGGAVKTGAKVIGVVAIAAIVAEIYPGLQKAAGELGASFWQALTGAVGGSADKEKGFLYGTVADTAGDVANTFVKTLLNSPVMRFTFWGPKGFFYVPDGVAQGAGETIGHGVATGVDVGLNTVNPITGFVENAVIAAGAGGTDTGEAFAGATGDTLTNLSPALIESFKNTFFGKLVDPAHQAAVEAAKALAAKEIWDNSARAIGSNLADALRSTKGNIASAMDDLTYVINHPLQGLKLTAQIEGALTSEKLQKALNSKNPDIRAQAEQTKNYLIGQWELLNARAYPLASDTSSDIKDGLNDDYPEIKTQASNFVSQLNKIFGGLDTNYTIDVNTSRIVKNVGGNRHDPVNQYASGGWAAAGETAWVGEGGAELVTFGSPAFITPANQSAAGLTMNGDIVINAPDGNSTSIKAAVMEALERVVDAYTPGMARRTSAAGA